MEAFDMYWLLVTLDEFHVTNILLVAKLISYSSLLMATPAFCSKGHIIL